jgi:hypothetical protein
VSAQLLRPIDICEVCDDLFPLVPIAEGVKVLRFKKIYLGKPGHYARVHHECYEAWKGVTGDTPVGA